MDNKFYDSIDDIINVINDRQFEENKHYQISYDKNDSFRSNNEVEEIGNFLNIKSFNVPKLASNEIIKTINYDILENKISKIYFTPSHINHPLNQNI